MATVDRLLRFRPLGAIFDGYLSVAPLAHALFRTAEARYLAEVPLSRPVLDLGCGAGQFAVAALHDVLDVGVDHSATQLAKARHTNRYHRCCQADARDLPFGNGEFRSVLSVSVLEHVPQPEAVLAEVHRVLRPGGRFVATVVLADLHEHLLFPRLFSRLRLPLLGRLYRRAHDALFGHRTLLPKEEWERLLGEAGFQVLVSKKVVSPSLTRWWDCLLLTAWPYLLYRPRRLWRPRWFRALAASLCRRTQAEAAEEGSVLLVVAQKPAAEDRSQPGPPPAPAAVKVPVLA